MTTSTMKRWHKLLIGAVLAVVAIAVLGPLIYKWINPPDEKATEQIDDLFAADPTDAAPATPAPTTLAIVDSAPAAPDVAPTDASVAPPAVAETLPAAASVDGAWSVISTGDVAVLYAGYRVDEVLNGQNITATGRTPDVTGSLTIAGSSVTAAQFEVNMSTVKSDQSRRDGQFTGDIMNVAEFPTANFVLTSPIELGTIPAEGEQVETNASGELTLRGVTVPVTFAIKAGLLNGQIVAAGEIAVAFADYGITPPDFGFVKTEDNGSIEFLLTFDRA